MTQEVTAAMTVEAQSIKKLLKTLLARRETSVAIILLLVVILMSFASEYFFTQRNLLNIGRQASVVAIVALGQTLVIIARGIDLSVGSVIGLSAVTGAIVAQTTGSQVLGIGGALGAGLAAGLFNAVLYTRFHINPFIATLGTLSIARGLALLMTGGIPVSFNGWASWFGAGRIADVPVSLVMMFLLAVLFFFLATRTRAGRNIYATGDNPTAARLAGIDVDRTRVLVFAVSGLLAGLGGLILAGNLNSASPDLGRGYELDVIAAVILGGTALSGGRGSIPGVILGALLMALLGNAFVLLGISSHWQVVTKGLVIVLAVGIDGIQRGRED
ncbi:ribose transport system permease protein [Yoonia sediminilitoris]|uniref:Autoinducer 2 import system permease protein LsrD n=2 Tax=Yoonia sediminilitoris TaxID=1286148 RepID=A0A2T6KAR4_9RHOB|nr:ribose transport system permease protein [Yoonia sediminilitoris]RCW91961.1 ribose transport system permease protein [Yoonia sediminilitoris]